MSEKSGFAQWLESTGGEEESSEVDISKLASIDGDFFEDGTDNYSERSLLSRDEKPFGEALSMGEELLLKKEIKKEEADGGGMSISPSREKTEYRTDYKPKSQYRSKDGMKTESKEKKSVRKGEIITDEDGAEWTITDKEDGKVHAINRETGEETTLDEEYLSSEASVYKRVGLTVKGEIVGEEVIDKIIEQLKEKKEGGRADWVDAWNYLEVYGFEGLNLTEEEKEELKSYGNPIKGASVYKKTQGGVMKKKAQEEKIIDVEEKIEEKEEGEEKREKEKEPDITVEEKEEETEEKFEEKLDEDKTVGEGIYHEFLMSVITDPELAPLVLEKLVRKLEGEEEIFAKLESFLPEGKIEEDEYWVKNAEIIGQRIMKLIEKQSKKKGFKKTEGMRVNPQFVKLTGEVPADALVEELDELSAEIKYWITTADANQSVSVQGFDGEWIPLWNKK